LHLKYNLDALKNTSLYCCCCCCCCCYCCRW